MNWRDEFSRVKRVGGWVEGSDGRGMSVVGRRELTAGAAGGPPALGLQGGAPGMWLRPAFRLRSFRAVLIVCRLWNIKFRAVPLRYLRP